MLLHHVLQSCLIFACLVANGTKWATLVVFVHAVSDIFMQSSKSINLLGHMRGPAYGTFVLAHLSWIYMRLMCSPALILSMWESVKMSSRAEERLTLSTFMTLLDIFLWCMVSLQYFWYFLILKVTWRFLTSGEIKDD